MPRNMSFSMTTDQIKDRTKTVTRRMGWRNLEPGQEVWAVEKAMGLKKGEKVKRLALLKVVDVRRERLELMTTAEEYPPGKYYGDRECVLEGFPDMSAADFVDMFVAANRCAPSDEVTRIEFAHLRLPSVDWLRDHCPSDLVVADPDGWDRSNLARSMAEPIHWDEFDLRLAMSSIYTR